MPSWIVEHPETGRRLRIEGDHEPTEAELNQIFDIAPPDRSAKKAALQAELKASMAEGESLDAKAKALDYATRAVEPLTAAGMLNQNARLMGYMDPYENDKPILTLPRSSGTGVGAGLVNLGAQTLEGLTTPEMVVTAPAAGVSAPIRALFAGQMAKGLPESIQQGAEVLADPEATTAEKVVAGGSPLVNAAMLRMIASEHAPKKASTVAKDIEAVADPKSEKVATKVPPGEPAPEVPPNVKVVETPDGTAVVNPEKVVAALPKEPPVSDPVSEATSAPVPPREPAATPETPLPAPEPPIAAAAPPVDPVAPADTTPIQAPTEPAPVPASDGTSIRNAVVDANREATGLPERTPPGVRDFELLSKEADGEFNRDPMVGKRLVDELLNKIRPLTDAEDAILTHEQDLRERAANAAIEYHDNAKGPDEKKVAWSKAAEAMARLREVYDVGQLAGAENGRGLGARRMSMGENFSLVKMVGRKSASKGEPLNDVELGDVKASHKRQQKIIEEHDAKVEEKSKLQAERTFNDLLNEMRGTAAKVKAAGGDHVSFLDRMAEQARARIRERQKTVSAVGDPVTLSVKLAAHLADEVIIGASHIAKGVKKLADWSKEMVREFGDSIKPRLDDLYAKSLDYHEASKKLFKSAAEGEPSELSTELTQRNVYNLAREQVKGGVTKLDEVIKAVHQQLSKDHPGLTERQVRDTFSDYGKTKFPNQAEDLKTLRDLRAQSQLVSQLEDAEAGKAPKKSGSQRDKPSDVVRDLKKKVADAMKAAGIDTASSETKIKGALDAVKTRLKNQISDIEKQLAGGEKASRKKGVEYDQEAKDLKTKRDELQKRLDDLHDTPEALLKEQQAHLEELVKSAMDRFENGTKKNAKGELIPDAKSEQMKALLDRINKTIREVNKSRKESAKGAPERSRLAALEKSVAEYERRIKERDFGSKPGRPLGPDLPEVELARQLRDMVKSEYEDLKNPPKDPEVVRREAYKKLLARKIQETKQRIAKGDYSKPSKRELAMDAEIMKLKADLKRERNTFELGLEQDRLSKRGPVEKAVDTVIKWERAFKLSGITTLGKLFNAGMTRLGLTPTEEVAGTLLHAIPGIRQISEMAPREGGGLNAKAEAKSISHGIVQGIKNMGQILKAGQIDRDVLLGKKGDLIELSGVFGRIHQLIKSPFKEAEFARSLEKRTQWALEHGFDPHDPIYQMKMVTEAAIDANRAIFMQDNFAVTGYRGLLKMLENNKQAPMAGKALSKLGQFLMPIVKVPTNLVGEVVTGAVGLPTGAVKAAMAFRNGLENLKPEEAEVIMRNLKKGSIGAAVLALGYFNPENVGGYYQEGGKRDPKDVKASKFRLWGVDVPGWMAHAPIYELAQIGATIRRVSDKLVADAAKKGEIPDAPMLSGSVAAAKGLFEEVPFLGTPIKVDKMVKGLAHGSTKEVGPLVRSTLVPQIVNNIAEFSDYGSPVRKPRNMTEAVKLGIPFLRQDVPVAR